MNGTRNLRYFLYYVMNVMILFGSNHITSVEFPLILDMKSKDAVQNAKREEQKEELWMLKVKYGSFLSLIVVPVNIFLMMILAINIIKIYFSLSYKRAILIAVVGTVAWVAVSFILKLILTISIRIMIIALKTIYETLKVSAVLPLTISEAKELLKMNTDEELTIRAYILAINGCITEHCILTKFILKNIENYISMNIEECVLQHTWSLSLPNIIKNTKYFIVSKKEENQWI